MAFLDFLGFRKKAELPTISRKSPINQITWLNVNGQVVPYDTKALTWVTKGLKGNADVYAIVTDIAQRGAEAPIDLYKEKKSGNQKRIKSELTEVENHPVLDLLNKPNEYQTREEFDEMIYLCLLIFGEVFVINVAGFDKPTQLHIFLPYEIVIDGEVLRRPTGYRIQSLPDKRFDPKDVLHIKLPNIPDSEQYLPTRGLAPLQSASMNLQKANAIEEAATYLSENKGAVGAAFVDEPDNDIEPTELESTWRKKAYGKGSEGRIMWSNSRLGFVSFVQSSSEMQIVDNGKYSTEQLCRVFHYPSLLLSNDSKTYDNYKTAVKQVLLQAVIPLQRRYYSKINGWLLPKFGLDSSYCLKVDTQYYIELQDDIKETVAALKDAYWISPNEKREWMDFDADPSPMANKLFIPSGMIPIDEASITPPDGNIDNMGDY